jgi:hypothetical protein
MYRIKNSAVIWKKASVYSLSLVMAVSALVIGVHPGIANAGTLTQTLVRFDRLQTSTQTTGTVCAKPATVGTEASVQVVYPTGYTLGAAGTFTVNTTNTNWPAGGTAWPSIATASNVTSQTVTFASGDLTVGTLYCFNWASTTAVQTASSASANNTGTVTTRTSTPTTIDSAAYSTVTMTSDSINVTASVPQSFTYALSNTSAAGGWMVWAQDATTGLRSPSTSYTLASTTPGSNSTLSSGTEGNNMGVTSTQTSGSGTVTVATPFVGGTTGKGGGLDTSLRTIASSNGTANNAVLTLTNNAAISTLTTAATDYADTITLPAAAMY